MSRVLVLALLLAGGCAALSDDLKRAEQTYEQARYEEALIWLSDLEKDTPDMNLDQRAEFYFLRGMTAYRLQQRDDALHYLALAREVAGDHTDALRPEWHNTMTATLEELTPTDRTYHGRQPDAAQTAGGEEQAAPGGETESPGGG